MDEKIAKFVVQSVEQEFVIEYTADGSTASDRTPLDALDTDALLRLARNAMEGYATAAEARSRGSELYRFLIGDRPWQDSVSDDVESGLNVHLVLDMREPALNALPWELLFDTDYLALMPNVRFSRLGDSSAPMRDFARPIQVILLTSSVPEFASEQEADAIFQALGPVQRNGLVYARQIRYQSPASLAQVPRCDILHISGHVELSGDGPMLVMERRQGVSFDQLVRVCRQAQPVLVFVNACNGAAMPPGRAEQSPVRQLQKEAGVPIVLGPYGMTTVWGATRFAVEFYESLVNGLSVAAAVARARRQVSRGLRRKGHRGRAFDWLSMVLYQSQVREMATGPVLADVSPPVVTEDLSEIDIAGGLMGPETGAPSWEEAQGEPVSAALPVDEAAPWVQEQVSHLGESPLVAKSPLSGSGQAPFTMPDDWDILAAPADAESIAAAEEQDETLAGLREFLREHVAGQDTLDLLRGALGAADRRQRVAAVETLGLLGEQQAVARKMLIELIADPDRAGADDIVRRVAVEQLGHIRHAEATDALLIAMADPVQDVRRAAEQALAQAQDRAPAASVQVRVSLPLESAEAMSWIAPLRAWVSTAELSPRRRIALMEQVESLRFELICPRPRLERIKALLDDLGRLSPQAQSLAMDITGRIEFTTPVEPQGGER